MFACGLLTCYLCFVDCWGICSVQCKASDVCWIEKTLTGKGGMGCFEPTGLWGHQAELISNLSEVLGPREGIFSRVWNSLCRYVLTSMVLPGTWAGLALALNLAHRTFENRTLSSTVTHLDPQTSTIPRWMTTGRLGHPFRDCGDPGQSVMGQCLLDGTSTPFEG